MFIVIVYAAIFFFEGSLSIRPGEKLQIYISKNNFILVNKYTGEKVQVYTSKNSKN